MRCAFRIATPLRFLAEHRLLNVAAMRSLLAGAAAVSVLCVHVSMAHADDDLVIAVRGAGSWPAAISALQHDPRSEGRALLVTVFHADGSRASCDHYQLTLDDAAREAFVVGTCDPQSHATTVTLVRRTALFSHDDVIPEPRVVGISAIAVSSGAIAGGAAAVEVGTALQCSVAVHPYRTDLEHGTRVPLTPGRFVLRPYGADVHVEAGPSDWTLRATAGTSADVAIEYDIVDTLHQRVVAHDRAHLHCANEQRDAPRSSITPDTREPIAHPPPPAPRSPAPMRWYGAISSSVLGVGYLPLGDVTFRQGNLHATGAELQTVGAWTYTASVGVVIGVPWFRASLQIAPYVGEHFLALQGVATTSLEIPLNGAFLTIGPHFAASSYTITHLAGRDVRWSSDWLPSMGVTAGIAYRSPARRSEPGLHAAEVRFDLAVPVWGSGAVVGALGIAWGGPL